MGKSSLMVRTPRGCAKKARPSSAWISPASVKISPQSSGTTACSISSPALSNLKMSWKRSGWQVSGLALAAVMLALREVVLKERAGQNRRIRDEIDAVRSLPFSADEFFAAIRQCYNLRAEDRNTAV